MRDPHANVTRRQVIATMLASAAGAAAFDTASAQGTPVASPVAGRELDAMLRLAAPPSGATEELFWYCDMAMQLAAFGIDRQRLDDLSDFPIVYVFGSLSSPSEIWVQMFEYEEGALPGFPPYQAERVAVAGPPEAPVEMWSGGFSTAPLPELLESLGYAEQEPVEDRQVWWVEPDARRSKLSWRYDAVAVVDDETVIFAPDVETIAASLQRWSGQAPSLADDAGVREVMATVPENTASFVLASGDALALDRMLGNMTAANVERVESELAATGHMPAIHLVAFGGTAGIVNMENVADWPEWTDHQPPQSLVVTRMLADDPEAAAEAVDVVTARIETLASLQSARPYREIFPIAEGFEDPVPGDRVAALDFEALASWATWWRSRDLLPFAVDEESQGA